MKLSRILIIFYLFGILLLGESIPDWKNYAEQLKNKLRKAYRKKMPRSKESISVGSSTFSALDYPKSVEILKEVENLWKEYYKCLESKYKVFSEEKSIYPNTIAAFTNTFIQ